jgi:hypothetical protein
MISILTARSGMLAGYTPSLSSHALSQKPHSLSSPPPPAPVPLVVPSTTEAMRPQTTSRSSDLSPTTAAEFVDEQLQRSILQLQDIISRLGKVRRRLEERATELQSSVEKPRDAIEHNCKRYHEASRNREDSQPMTGGSQRGLQRFEWGTCMSTWLTKCES